MSFTPIWSLSEIKQDKDVNVVIVSEKKRHSNEIS